MGSCFSTNQKIHNKTCYKLFIEIKDVLYYNNLTLEDALGNSNNIQAILETFLLKLSKKDIKISNNHFVSIKKLIYKMMKSGDRYFIPHEGIYVIDYFEIKNLLNLFIQNEI